MLKGKKNGEAGCLGQGEEERRVSAALGFSLQGSSTGSEFLAQAIT